MSTERAIDFAVGAELVEDIRVVTVKGEVDIAKKAMFAAALASGSERMVVDLSAVRFMDSSGLAALVAAQQARNGRGERLAIVLGPGSPVQRLLDLSGMDELFAAYPSRRQALEGLARDD